MGTLRKWWRKLRRWFDRKGSALLEEVKGLIKEAFEDMQVDITELFDERKRRVIAEELKARVHALRDDLADWLIDWAMELLWDEVTKGFIEGRSK